MVNIPIVSDLLRGPQSKDQQDFKTQEPIRLTGQIPTTQPGQLPSYDVVKEAARTNQVTTDFKKKYRGFDLDNAAPFGNIAVGRDEVIRMEFEIQQEVLANFTPVDCVFDDDFEDRRLEIIQDGVLVQQQFSKAINSNLLNRALGAYSNLKTEIQTGGINNRPIEQQKKGGLFSFLMR